MCTLGRSRRQADRRSHAPSWLGAASGGFVSSRRPDGINTEVERSGTILSARLPRLSPRAVAQDTFAPGHHTNDVIMPDPFFNARRRLDPIAVYPAWRATQP